MSYDPYTNTDDWSFLAQVALWRERAIHQSQRAEFYKRLAEAERNGTTIKPSAKVPAL
jgi:hypothetical protein